LAVLDISSHGKSMTFEWGDITLHLKLMAAEPNQAAGTLEVNLIPYEDSIHPNPLLFDPPLQECTPERSTGFAPQWEKLNYACALPDPRTSRC
jgi:hypothetical protein